jgi:aminoglycoside/choline kinase family phosphotransferase
MNHSEALLTDLFKENTGSNPSTIFPLPVSGSDRSYYRLSADGINLIGAFNKVVRENEAFIYFTRHFHKKGLPVPEIIDISDDSTSYLQTDLGDDTLFSVLSQHGLTDKVKNYYREVVKWLPSFQLDGIDGLELSYCYPRSHFDKQSMMWDLNYFKYYFARLSGIEFDEQALENDFETLTSFLLESKSNYFMFRDFQSRNVMIVNNKPYFIDYQGGRSGPLQYDLASLLYDAKANLPQDFREELLNLYLETMQQRDHSFISADFLRYFNGFVLMRILQAMGAYGFRGYYQKKELFLQSIPYAVNNLKYLFSQATLNMDLPELRKLTEHELTDKKLNWSPTSLTVRVTSFSFKNGIPEDPTGNGGGFVFDCRALPNPGRLVEYQQLSGLDEPVISYLKAYPEVDIFLQNVFNIIDAAVKNYIERGFHHLMVNFGCTGGRHRSVYCAEKLSAHLNEKFGLNINVEHSEQTNW